MTAPAYSNELCLDICHRVYLHQKPDIERLLKAMDERGYVMGDIDVEGTKLPYCTLVMPLGHFSHVAFDAPNFERRIKGNLLAAAKQLEGCCVTFVLPQFFTEAQSQKIWAWSGIDHLGTPRGTFAYDSVKEMWASTAQRSAN